ncbi:MAG: hypothetical protein QOC70_2278 [Verrucomicrobiota bacterium]|jgi:hypothetical protein
MNISEKLRGFRMPAISSQAMIGIGITIAELGLLCLLLALAEHLRSVPKIAMVWLVLGVVLLIVGGLTAALPRLRDRRRIQADRFPQSGVQQDEAPREPEEQLY